MSVAFSARETDTFYQESFECKILCRFILYLRESVLPSNRDIIREISMLAVSIDAKTDLTRRNFFALMF